MLTMSINLPFSRVCNQTLALLLATGYMRNLALASRTSLSAIFT